jgi:LCP family protein required for cell wall assembly
VIACLLAARNAAVDMPGYLESAAGFADVVIGLDDGSTDETRELLEASPLVEAVLENPRRKGFGGWDDAANRERLLDAAGDLKPDWIVFLDSDERLDREDADALRGFLRSDALPGCAYGLELHRMWGDDRCVPGFTWVHRIFFWAPGQTLPRRRLHFNPVPAEIPRAMWVRTTIRVRHLDSPERLTERLAKYREADPERAYERRPARLLEEPSPDGLMPWRRRSPDTPVLDPARVATRRSESSGQVAEVDAHPPAGSGRIELACLLPVRNGEADLPGYLECAGRLADAVVALDDGSTDATHQLLEASPLVELLISNPPRHGYGGWDDAANRQRLLGAAAELEPNWVLWLDVDERIDAEDAKALRGFLAKGAEPGYAYSFRVFRMIGDDGHYDDAGLWVGRLFAWEPGQRLPDKRLHLVPVPLSIPKSRWKRTTVRIKHLAGLTEKQRASRLRKHLEADPSSEHQRDYSHLVKPPGKLKAWTRRPEGFPVLADPMASGRALDLHTLGLDAPFLSAIVISRNNERTIERSVRSVVNQECPNPFEVIVVVSGEDRTAEIVRDRFPEVALVELEGEALPGRARNAGLAEARGDYVSFPGSHVELPQGSLAARMRAHELGYAMVTGSTLNGTNTRSSWASYFLDHHMALPGRPSGELERAPTTCSYNRDFLQEIGGFPEDRRAGEDTIVNRELARRGHRAYRSQELRLVHRSPCTDPWRLLWHHFIRGRALGRIVCDEHRRGAPLLRRRFAGPYLLRYVPQRLRRLRRSVDSWGGDLWGEYRAVRPLIWAGAIAAWLGMWVEILRPAPRKLSILLADRRPPEQRVDPLDRGGPRRTARAGWHLGRRLGWRARRILFGRSELTLLIGGLDGWPSDPWPGRADLLLLARFDFVEGRTWLVSLPRAMVVDIPGEGRELINAAYNLGRRRGGNVQAGSELLRSAVAAACGIMPDDHLLLDFTGFPRLIDAFGGIELDVPHEIHDETPGGFKAHFEAGRQRMSGDRALDYVRTRKTDSEPARRRRQLDAALATIVAARRVRSPLRLARVIIAARAFETSLGTRGKLAVALHLLRAGPRWTEVAQLSHPLLWTEHVSDGQDGLVGDPEAIAAFVRRQLGIAAGREVPKWVEVGGWTEGWLKPWTVGPGPLRWRRFKRQLRKRGLLSPHYTVDEFASKAGKCGCARSFPKRKQRKAQQLAFRLERCRHRLGDRQIGVLSGYRSPRHNHCVGGAPASRHVVGDAIDPIKPSGVPWAKFNRVLAAEFDGGGIGRGCDTGQVQHVDVGRKRRWCYPGR